MRRKKTVLALVILVILAAAGVVIGILYVRGHKEPEKSIVTVEEDPEPGADPEAGQARSLLTGEWIDASLVRNRPIAIMMEDTKAALPLYGLNSAGVVYEAPVEGGITRLVAIMENYGDLERIGNVRSCRPYYVYIASEYDAVYVHYGQSVQGLEVLNTGIVDNLSGLDGSVESTVFFRTSDRKSPHNAYASGQGIIAGIAKKGYDTTYAEDYSGHWIFAADDSPVTLEGGADAAVIKPYYPYNKPYFVYNKDTGLYERFQFGEEDIDAVDNSQVYAKNIIFQFVPSSIYSGTQYLNIPLNGSGTGKFFTNGKMVDITWKKNSNSDITRYYDAAGNEIVLNPGKTWVCLIQNSYDDRSEIYATVEEFEAQ